MIYLDNNATSFLAPEIADRMLSLMRQNLANPSSQHASGRAARSIVEQARNQILEVLGAQTKGMASDSLLFTSGGTEANNLAINGLLDANPGRLLVSAIEHPSVLATAERLAQLGREVDYVRVTSSGVVDLAHLQSLFETSSGRTPVSVVSIMAANNETGVVQPIKEVAEICAAHDAVFHSDAVQLVGKLPFSFQDSGLNALTFTAHKLHGPIGIGGLILKHGTKLTAQQYGGFQQQALRPGTESAILSDALNSTLALAKDMLPETAAICELRDLLELKIQESIPDVVINGSTENRLPHTTSVSFLGVDRQALQLALDMRGIACSTGSACASGSSQPSHVLQSMRVDEAVLKGAIRLSLSRYTTADEIMQAVTIIQSAVTSLRKINTLKFGKF